MADAASPTHQPYSYEDTIRRLRIDLDFANEAKERAIARENNAEQREEQTTWKYK